MDGLSGFGLFTALGLAVGLVLARLAARGRRLNLEVALKAASADVERLGYVCAALTAHPFRHDNATVHAALNHAEFMRERARRDVLRLRELVATSRGRAP